MTSAYSLPVDLSTTDQDDFNAALQNSLEAMKILHGSALASPVANYFWHDASTNKLMKRNAANGADVVIIPNTEAVNGGLLGLSGSTLTGDLNFGGFKGTNLGAATVNGDALRFQDMTRLEKQFGRIYDVDGFPVGSGATGEFGCFCVTHGITIVLANVAVELGNVFNSTDYYTVKLKNFSTGNIIASKSFQSVTVTARSFISMGSISNANVSANDILVIRIENTLNPSAFTTAKCEVSFDFKNQ